MNGSVTKRPFGKWLARYRDGTGKESSKTFDRKIDGQDWVRDQLSALRNGTYIDPAAGKVTFADYYRDWSRRQLWVQSTRAGMDLSAGSVPFGSVPLRSVRRSHIESWVKSMVSKGLAASTIQNRYANIHSVLRAALKGMMIATDPAEGVTLPRRRRAEHAMRLPLVSEVHALLTAADDEQAVMLALCAFGGLRAGEACGVQVQDVNFLRRSLHIARQVQRGAKGVPDIRPPKIWQ